MKYLLRLLVIILVASCTQDAYEKGEGAYSLMRGDFAEANVNSNREVTSITTDDGEILPLTSLATAQWISRPDTIYRCMLYYNKVKAADGKLAAEVISLGRVPCLYVKPLISFEKTYKDDPVKFESIWNSKSGKYLNLHLQLKTGCRSCFITTRATSPNTIPPRPMSASRQHTLPLTPSVSISTPIPAPSSRPCLFNR